MEGRRFVGAKREEEAFQAGLGWLSSDFSETVLQSPPLQREAVGALRLTLITETPRDRHHHHSLLTQKPHSC